MEGSQGVGGQASQLLGWVSGSRVPWAGGPLVHGESDMNEAL